MQTRLGTMTEAVLETAIAYSNACETGIIVHISAGRERRNAFYEVEEIILCSASYVLELFLSMYRIITRCYCNLFSLLHSMK